MDTPGYIEATKKYTLDLSLWLDDYDDIYSDFDSRNYLKRRISTDFIEELQVALKNKKEEINDLVLLLPAEKRDPLTEPKISESLKSYFHRQEIIFKQRFESSFKKGIFLLVVALFLMVVNSVISFKLQNSLLSSIIRIILEPSGWFLIWVSFDMLYYDLKELKVQKRFFQELSELKIYFQSSESYKK